MAGDGPERDGVTDEALARAGQLVDEGTRVVAALAIGALRGAAIVLTRAREAAEDLLAEAAWVSAGRPGAGEPSGARAPADPGEPPPADPPEPPHDG